MRRRLSRLVKTDMEIHETLSFAECAILVGSNFAAVLTDRKKPDVTLCLSVRRRVSIPDLHVLYDRVSLGVITGWDQHTHSDDVPAIVNLLRVQGSIAVNSADIFQLLAH